MNRASKDDEIPHLHNLGPQEVKAIKQLFLFYDIGKTGKIKQHLAHNLFKKLGLVVKLDLLKIMVTLKDVLVLADQRCPSDPNSDENIDIFCRMVSRSRNGMAAPVQASQIINFLAGVQNIPPSESEARLLLTRMGDYDDCGEDPVVEAAVFRKEVLAAYKELQALQQEGGM